MLDDMDQLRCPRCKSADGMHHGSVTVLLRCDGEDSRGYAYRVGPEVVPGVVRTPVAAKDFPGRRDCFRAEFRCEFCGPVGTLLVRQHKGATCLSWEK